MIYIKRFLWVIFFLPMILLITTFAFLIGLLVFPLLMGGYYIKYGTISSFKMYPDTLATMTGDFFLRFQPKVK